MASATLPSIRPVTIATHSGKFHCDEVLGTVMLDKILGRPNNYSTSGLFIDLVRTRNAEVIRKADIVIAVGAEFGRLPFREHQRRT
ncbi:hypothetical protein FOZ62_005797 [Perkinsus olseni]|uniref:Uncharacterized protein n=1 Tax=Perkinsus olseni TaxID=32597 RepID=A0A7J6T1T8_PEROL|nr:hypothetical protein FOZ62_005797 [Perkinsus olseni]